MLGNRWEMWRKKNMYYKGRISRSSNEAKIFRYTSTSSSAPNKRIRYFCCCCFCTVCSSVFVCRTRCGCTFSIIKSKIMIIVSFFFSTFSNKISIKLLWKEFRISKNVHRHIRTHRNPHTLTHTHLVNFDKQQRIFSNLPMYLLSVFISFCVYIFCERNSRDIHARHTQIGAQTQFLTVNHTTDCVFICIADAWTKCDWQHHIVMKYQESFYIFFLSRSFLFFYVQWTLLFYT